MWHSDVLTSTVITFRIFSELLNFSTHGKLSSHSLIYSALELDFLWIEKLTRSDKIGKPICYHQSYNVGILHNLFYQPINYIQIFKQSINFITVCEKTGVFKIEILINIVKKICFCILVYIWGILVGVIYP